MYKSRREIVITFLDHLDSLEMSGMDYDAKAVVDEMDTALAEWDETHPVTGL
jgi:hypothetical protein